MTPVAFWNQVEGFLGMLLIRLAKLLGSLPPPPPLILKLFLVVLSTLPLPPVISAPPVTTPTPLATSPSPASPPPPSSPPPPPRPPLPLPSGRSMGSEVCET